MQKSAVILLILPVFVYSILLRITSFQCNVNKDICKKNVCSTTVVRRRFSLLNFNCFFVEPQSKLRIHMKVYKKQRKTLQPWRVDVKEDICRVIDKTAYSQLFNKILPNLRKFGRISEDCPLVGNVSLFNYPMDFSIIPAVIPEGSYVIRSIIRDFEKNITVINSNLMFVVEYFKRIKH